jgi:hypothetical protein
MKIMEKINYIGTWYKVGVDIPQKGRPLIVWIEEERCFQTAHYTTPHLFTKRLAFVGTRWEITNATHWTYFPEPPLPL